MLGQGLGLDHRQLGVAVHQHIVGDLSLAALAGPLDTPMGDRIFALDTAALDHAPACCAQGRVDQFGAGFSFVHCNILLAF
ncbi:hypothetical protein D3C85_1374550 [compost metagenome]